jgi:hypothetical protein
MSEQPKVETRSGTLRKTLLPRTDDSSKTTSETPIVPFLGASALNQTQTSTTSPHKLSVQKDISPSMI